MMRFRQEAARRAGAAVLLGACTASMLSAKPASALQDDNASPVARYLVAASSSSSAAAAVRAAGGAVLVQFDRVYSGVSAELSEEEVGRVSRVPGMRVFPDSRVQVASVRSNDPDKQPWGLDRIDQQALPLDGVFSPVGAGPGVQVYVVDTGVNVLSSRFTGRTGAGFTLPGEPLDVRDCNGHGTATASVAAGSDLGVAKKSTVVPVKAIGCDGYGYALDVMAGLDWVVRVHPGKAKGVVLLPFSGPGYEPLDEAVRRVVKSGLPVVAASGNAGEDACSFSPGRVPEAITVGATALGDTKAFFSSSGTCVDLFAPGSSVTVGTPSGGVTVESGTSYAAAAVAGAVAVGWGKNPTGTVSEVSKWLFGTATQGVVVSAGTAPNRLLYVGPDPESVTSGRKPPTAVPSVEAVGESGEVYVSWSAPTSGAPLTGYRIGVTQGNAVVGSYVVDDSTTAVRVVLPAGDDYVVTVYPANRFGEGPGTGSNGVTVR